MIPLTYELLRNPCSYGSPRNWLLPWEISTGISPNDAQLQYELARGFYTQTKAEWKSAGGYCAQRAVGDP